MMLDGPDVRVSESVTQLGKVQTLLKIVECGLFIRTKCRKKLNPKLHSVHLPAIASTATKHHGLRHPMPEVAIVRRADRSPVIF
jgi:hypothetical protein